MAGKINGAAKWVMVVLIFLGMLANIIWQSSALSSAVANHERRITRNETILDEIRIMLIDIKSGQKVMMRKMK